MDRLVVKNLIIYNLIIGLGLGLLAWIPVLGLIALLALIFLCAPITIVYMIMSGDESLTATKESIIGGAIAGFSANLTFGLSYSIAIFIMSYGFHYSPNLILSSMIINSPIWLLVVFILFVGVLTATTNAFSGFGTCCLINFIRDMYEKKHNSDNNFKDLLK